MNLDAKVELKPCPFCGGDAAFNTRTYCEATVRDQEWDQDTFHGVNCVRCGVDNVGGLTGYATQEAAADRWNTRALEQSDAEREQPYVNVGTRDGAHRLAVALMGGQEQDAEFLRGLITSRPKGRFYAQHAARLEAIADRLSSHPGNEG